MPQSVIPHVLIRDYLLLLPQSSTYKTIGTSSVTMKPTMIVIAYQMMRSGSFFLKNVSSEDFIGSKTTYWIFNRLSVRSATDSYFGLSCSQTIHNLGYLWLLWVMCLLDGRTHSFTEFLAQTKLSNPPLEQIMSFLISLGTSITLLSEVNCW